MKKPYFVLIPVTFKKSFELSKEFMNKEFKSLGEIASAITDALNEDSKKEDEEVLVYSIESFCTACNDQTLENLNDYYLTKVNLID